MFSSLPCSVFPSLNFGLSLVPEMNVTEQDRNSMRKRQASFAKNRKNRKSKK